MAITIEQIRTKILDWAKLITNRQIILANSAGGQAPRPASPYVEVFVEEFDVPANQVSELSPTEDIETVKALTQLNILLDIYGGDAMQAGSRLCRSLFSAQRYLDLWQECGLIGIEDVRDLTFLQTGARKARAQMRFTIDAVLSEEFDGKDIETVEIELTVNDRDTVDIEAVKGGCV